MNRKQPRRMQKEQPESEEEVEQVHCLGSQGKQVFQDGPPSQMLLREGVRSLPHHSPRFATVITSWNTMWIKVAGCVPIKWGWWSLSQWGNICKASSTMSPRMQRAPLLSDKDNVYGVRFLFVNSICRLVSLSVERYLSIFFLIEVPTCNKSANL